MSKLNRYEGLFILNTAGKDEGVTEILSHIESEIQGVGGKVDNVQKMDRRQFARPSHKMASGYYANVIFRGPSDAASKLNARFRLDERIFRVMFLRKEEPKEEKRTSKSKGAVKTRG